MSERTKNIIYIMVAMTVLICTVAGFATWLYFLVIGTASVPDAVQFAFFGAVTSIIGATVPVIVGYINRRHVDRLISDQNYELRNGLGSGIAERAANKTVEKIGGVQPGGKRATDPPLDAEG